MPLIESSAQTVAGSAGNDILVSFNTVGTTTINAGAGNDVVYGDHSGRISVGGVANTINSATDLSSLAVFSRQENPDVADSRSVSYAKVLFDPAGAGKFFLQYTGTAGQRLDVDVDYADDLFTPDSNVALRIFDSDRTSVLASNFTNPDPDPRGSILPLDAQTDPFLSYTFTSTKTVYIEISEQSGFGNFEGNEQFMAYVSVTGQGTNGTEFNNWDVIRGEAGDDTLYGMRGNDTIDGGADDDYIDGGSGRDSLTGGNGRDVIHGDRDNDRISGGGSGDSLFGGNGDDRVFGRDGNDVIEGNRGNDRVYGDKGADTVSGGAGDDKVGGGHRDDVLRGNGGDDRMFGHTGADTAYGGDGSDVIFGNEGRDVLEGGNRADTISGGAGDDTIRGDDNGDSLHGNSGKDTIFGGAGSDLIRGGSQDDTIDGGAGWDTMYGNDGADTFVWSFLETGVTDVVMDFDPTEDILRIDVAPGQQVTVESATGGSLVTAGLQEIFVSGVTVPELNSGNIDLV